MIDELKYLYRVAERQKAAYTGRRETAYTIFHNANAMKLSFVGMKNERGQLVFAWQDTVQVKAFKRDLYAVDLICLAILMKNNKAVEINEEMSGWESLVEKLPQFAGMSKIRRMV